MLKYGFFVLTLSSALADADCDFNTSEYLEELSSPRSINSISIEIPKSKKWFENGFKIILDKSPIIKRKHKKKYKAKIKVRYSFGSCSFAGTVRQTGDNKDHIEFTDLVARQSLKVNLDSGNVLSATSFKLLLPSTRGGDNEIFGTLLLSQLGYIAPKTFSEGRYKTSITINEAEYLKYLQGGVFDKSYGLCMPVLSVCYFRDYYSYKGIRITIDKEIEYGKFGTHHTFRDTHCVLEFKAPAGISIDFLDGLVSTPLSRFSKYSRGYQNLIA